MGTRIFFPKNLLMVFVMLSFASTEFAGHMAMRSVLKKTFPLWVSSCPEPPPPPVSIAPVAVRGRARRGCETNHVGSTSLISWPPSRKARAHSAPETVSHHRHWQPLRKQLPISMGSADSCILPKSFANFQCTVASQHLVR